jgi:hypothetical protein
VICEDAPVIADPTVCAAPAACEKLLDAALPALDAAVLKLPAADVALPRALVALFPADVTEDAIPCAACETDPRDFAAFFDAPVMVEPRVFVDVVEFVRLLVMVLSAALTDVSPLVCADDFI